MRENASPCGHHGSRNRKCFRETSQFKDSEEGVEIMCTLIEEYAEKRAQEAEARGMEKGMEKGMKEIICNMLSSNLTCEQIANLTKQPLERIREIAQKVRN